MSFTCSAAELTLSDCLKTAQGRSLQNILSSFDEQRAHAAVTEAKAVNLPHLSAIGAYSKSDDPATQLPDANKAAIRVEQNAFPFSATWLKQEQKSLEAEIAQLNHSVSQIEVRFLVKQLYFSILRDEDTIRYLAEIEKRLQSLNDTVIPKFSMGRAPSFDLVKVQVALADLSRNREQTLAQLTGEKTQLAALLGLELKTPLTLAPIKSLPKNLPKNLPEKLPEKFPEMFNIQETSPLSHPSLLGLGKQIRASEIGLRSEKYARWPLLSAAFEYGYAGQTSDTMTLGWDFSVGLKLPLWNWNEITSQVEQAQVAVHQAETQLKIE